MEEPTKIANWTRISILGSGAFGVVTLWQNQLNNDYIAIKKCKWMIKSHITAKQRDRWQNEVQIMKTLNNLNIVAYKALPDELEQVLKRHNPTKLPLLSMEYCRNGNLRHVLAQTKNVCGLMESDVRMILNDLTNAVSYLHRLKITHRDIKPDNIVLQEDAERRPNGTIYKLIDLGYAKELNDSNVSFVGTLHYLAPEILRGEHYNCSVDYWSMGILTFEIICGVLPFLPNLAPISKYQFIAKKQNEDICIYQTHAGSIRNSSELIKENHLSVCFKQEIETWLRHVLQFDYEKRAQPIPSSRNDADSTVDVFQCLRNILAKTIVRVFSVHTFEFYSYEVNNCTLLGTLKEWIARDTKVRKEEQVLLQRDSLKEENKDSELIGDHRDDQLVVEWLQQQDWHVFVVKKGAFIPNTLNRQSPNYIKVLFQQCTTPFNWTKLRPIFAKTIFYIDQEADYLANLSNTFHLFVAHVRNRTQTLQRRYCDIDKKMSNLLSNIDCYSNLRKENNSNSIIVNELYIESMVHLQYLLRSLKRAITSGNQLRKQFDVLMKRQLVLDSFAPKMDEMLRKCNIKQHLEKATVLFARCSSNVDDIDKNRTCSNMCKIVSDVIKVNDKLLYDDRFTKYALATSIALQDVDNLLEWMESYRTYINKMSSDIDATEKSIYQHLLRMASSTQQNTPNLYTNRSSDIDINILILDSEQLQCQLDALLTKSIQLHKQFIEDISDC